eukprot:scaffold1236_cov179-Skeletonema_dohrnii-CCMP3373.AAC.1
MDMNLINAVKNRKNEGDNNSLSPFSTAGNNNNWEGFYYCPPSPLLQPDLIDFRFNLAVDIRSLHMSTSTDPMDAKHSFDEQSRLFDRGNPSRSSEFGERQKMMHGFAVEGIGECHATIIVPVDGEQIKRRGVDVSIVWIVITDANVSPYFANHDDRLQVVICKYAPHVGTGIFACAMLVGENGELVFDDVKYHMTTAVDIGGIIIVTTGIIVPAVTVASPSNNGIYYKSGEVFPFASVIISSFNGFNVVDVSPAPYLACKSVGNDVIDNVLREMLWGDLMQTQVHEASVGGELILTQVHDTFASIDHDNDDTAMHLNENGVADNDDYPLVLVIIVPGLIDMHDRRVSLTRSCLMCGTDHVSWNEEFDRRLVYGEHSALLSDGEHRAGRELLSLGNGSCCFYDGLNIPGNPAYSGEVFDDDALTYGNEEGLSSKSEDVISGELDALRWVHEWGEHEGVLTKQEMIARIYAATIGVINGGSLLHISTEAILDGELVGVVTTRCSAQAGSDESFCTDRLSFMDYNDRVSLGWAKSTQQHDNAKQSLLWGATSTRSVTEVYDESGNDIPANNDWSKAWSIGSYFEYTTCGDDELTLGMDGVATPHGTDKDSLYFVAVNSSDNRIGRDGSSNPYSTVLDTRYTADSAFADYNCLLVDLFCGESSDTKDACFDAAIYTARTILERTRLKYTTFCLE